MVTSILYTKSNEQFNSIEEVAEFAETNDIYFTCLAGDDSQLAGVVPGDRILTTKGNTLYVLETSFRRNAYPFAKPSSITEIVELEPAF